jgi:hypothetical protein
MVFLSRHWHWLIALLLSGSPPAVASLSGPRVIGPDEIGSLAKRLQNPVAKVISLPLENISAFGVGAGDQIANTLNVQARIPIPAGLFNVITRTVLPIAYLPSGATGGGDGVFGLGDMTTAWYLSPAEPCLMTWGLGPVWYFPTATRDRLGTDQFGLGPSVVLLASPGPWVFGLELSWIWSFAGQAERPDVDRTSLQYFVYYNLPRGWYLSTAPIITADWTKTDGDEWTVPFGAGVGKVVLLGPVALNFQIHGYGNAVKPAGGPEASLRVQLELVLPALY